MSRKMTPRSDSDSPRETTDRAQPGDVLGVETGGKRTNLGDDAEDEDEELEDTEEEILEENEDDV
jgi:hypothetical protein